MVCVWSRYDVGGAGDLVKAVRVGTLDQAWKVAPDVHIFARSKVPFVRLGGDGDGKPVYEGFYPDRDFYREDARERFGAVIKAVVEGKEKKKSASL